MRDPLLGEPSAKTLGLRARLGIALALLLLVGGSLVNDRLATKEDQAWAFKGLLGKVQVVRNQRLKAEISASLIRAHSVLGLGPESLARLRAIQVREADLEAEILARLVENQGFTQEEAEAWISNRRASSEAEFRGIHFER